MTTPRRARLRDVVRGWSLRRRVAITFGSLAILVLVMIVSSVVALADFVSTGNAVVYRWQPAVTRSQVLLSDLVNQETGVRGYALSGQSDLLAPYTVGVAQESTDEAALMAAFRGQQQLQQALTAFEQASSVWHSETAAVLILAVQRGDTNVAARLDAQDDKTRFDVVRLRAAQLTSAVVQQSRQARTARSRAEYALIVALSITGVVVVLAGLLLWRGLHRWVLGPVDLLAEQTRIVAAGDTERSLTPSGPPEIAGLGADVEAMRGRIADELRISQEAREELVRSNSDLEQFAYVASHDLSEPLRKVANFSQLLERQYGPQLDDRAREYIAFSVDGARRMQALIADLLSVSRVGRTTDAFVDVDLAEALDQALSSLSAPIAAAHAAVMYDSLPVVRGDRSLLAAVFENLVGNAVKYRGQDAPRVSVTATLDEASAEWTVSVVDNGIGIDPQYSERIFAIFQRLHLRDQYSGTGIGLALCRKIVEFHGGRIWLDGSYRGPGARFAFTVPQLSGETREHE